MTAGRTHDGFVGVETGDGWVRLTLRRPPLNILHLEAIGELNRALRGVRDRPDLRALVLAAEGKAFSAGVAVEDHLPERVEAMIEAFHAVFRQLQAVACPVVAVVQGAALGGGCELACAADLVLAAESAKLGQPEIKLGVFPPIAAVCLPERVGRARALRMILTGEVVSAREAERIGLVDRVAPDDGLAALVRETLDHFLGLSAPALRLAKRAVREAAGRRFDERVSDVERLFLGDLMLQTADATEGLRAFLDKREPRWSHR